MPLDIDQIRKDTPAFNGPTNSLNPINHLLACGSALMPQTVLDAMTDHLNLEAQIGGYEAHKQRSQPLDFVYDQVAQLIGANRNEIALLENATAAWCHAFYALPLKAGDRILTCQAEYAANYVAFLQRAKRDGVEIVIIPSDDTGRLDLEALKNLIDDRVALIAITWIPTNGGLVNPAKEVGKIANDAGIPYLLDACQAIGQMPVNVNELGCDFLSATGRKFLRGPRGTGFLYIKQALIETLEPIIIDHFAAPWVDTNEYKLRPDARRFENWENAYALRAGLGAAIAYANDLGMKNIQTTAWGLADYLRQQLSTIKAVHLQDNGRPNSPNSNHQEQCAIVSFSIDGQDPHNIVAKLHTQNIIIGASSPDSTLLDAQSRNLPTILRAAPHYYNTRQEVDLMLEAITTAIGQ